MIYILEDEQGRKGKGVAKATEGVYVSDPE
jgi:hypothetical protein